MQNLHEESALRTNNTGAKNGDVLSLMIPWSIIAVHYCSSSAFWSPWVVVRLHSNCSSAGHKVDAVIVGVCRR